MARPERPDPYETAAARIGAERRGREMGDPIPEMPPGLGPAMPTNRLRRLLVVMSAVLVVLVLGGLVRSASPTSDCRRTSFQLTNDIVTQDEVARWRATGRDAPRLRVRVDGVAPPRAGSSGKACAAQGFFAVDAEPGSHVVTLVDPARANAVRARATLEVIPR